MAIYKLNSKKQKDSNPNVRKIVGFSLIGAGSLIFLFLTGIIKPLQTFFLGLFGVFGFPLCIIFFVVGLALLNHRRYVMSKKYTISLIISIILLLCILQLAIVGNKTGSFWKYWGKNYSDKWTAGGFLIGTLTTIFLYMTNLVGAYIIFALGLVISGAILIDSLNRMRQNKQEQESVTVQIKDKNGSAIQSEDEQPKQLQSTEEVNVVLDGNLKEQDQPQKPLTAKQILGLDKKRNKAYGYDEELPNPTVAKAPPEPEKPKTLKELILTPPTIDLDEYFKDLRGKGAPEAVSVNQNVQELKGQTVAYDPQPQPTQAQRQEIKEVLDIYKADRINQPKPQVSEQQFVSEENEAEIEQPVSLEAVDTEELVEEADSILKEVIEAEKAENPEMFAENNPEMNVINSLPDRDNTGALGRRDFERRDFGNRDNNIDLDRARKSFNDSVLERTSSITQEDKDARGEFNRQRETLDARNGVLAREQQPITPEEEEVIEPYNYQRPSLDLITTQSVDLSTLADDVAEKRVLLENALEQFGVPAKVQNVIVGPAVTRYELEMPQGVPVSKIKNRVDDIAYALAAEGAIRIEAPVPGKSCVGIEIPNKAIATVSLKDILNSRQFVEARSPLTFAIGKDLTGETVCCNMQKLTHLLVAGATNSGKSVCLNAIIMSIIYKASPEDVKIMLIDPKRVEFAIYEALPHLIMPQIINDPQVAANALGWAVEEMERRYDMLTHARVRNIDEYNTTQDVLDGKIRKMPFLVIIIDELADLMMTARHDVEDNIVRLAQKARAAGIHLILATQRPSKEVVTGLIKSNIPSRISFSVVNTMNSLIVIDRVGAEKLLGRGDMLYFPIGAKDPARVQGCFLSTNEISNIVDYVRDNNKPVFDKSIQEKITNPNKFSKNDDRAENKMDELLPQVLKMCIETGTASATMIRRKFGVGYPRAAMMLDQMENAGYVSVSDGAKGRKVFLTMEEFEQLFGSDF
ncbi:MAG: DNA translocase FtsK [Clostridia bacterium]|nr:DNA translocase FtsK [Clostridia bacterium]